MIPNTQPTSPVQGVDPRVLVQMLLQQIKDNSISATEFWQANAIAGIVDRVRIVFRALAVDVPSGQWGTPEWTDGYGEFSTMEGTTNIQSATRFMALSRVSPDGLYEVQLSVNGQWYSAASLLNGLPMVPNTVGGVPQLYMPSVKAFSVYSFGVPAQQFGQAYQQPPANPASPIGAAVPGFSNAFKNVGGPNFNTNGMTDPSGQYKLENPSPTLNDWSKMLWIKQGA